MTGSRREPSGAELVEARIEAMAEPHRSTLRVLRSTLRRLLPTAEEGIKYGMPTFLVEGKNVVSYDAFLRHCSYFPHSGAVLEKAGPLPEGCSASKGTLQFGPEKGLPVALVRRLVRLRLDEIGDVRNGVRLEFFDDGTVKARGPMKDGLPHGTWSWYRKDGTLSQTGRLVRGERAGLWETFDVRGVTIRSERFG